ncbi:MAG: tRNA (adenosine(37)-N6)-threonylcarbamoyltransferase complex ATPase subunit type 1 TsaE [Flavitalea sp.]
MEWQYRLDEIDAAAMGLWEAIKNERVIAFTGEMGAGKTTMIRSICKMLGVREQVSSPTFSIINEYSSGHGIIYHIDLYRCESEEEAFRAGVEECLYSGETCFVEWPSRAPGIFAETVRQVTIELTGEQTRKLTVKNISQKELTASTRM